VDRPDDGGVPVAEVLARDSAGEVEELVALGIPDPRAPGARDDEIGRGHAAGHEPLTAPPQLLGGRHLFDPHRGRVSH
jgi:hypothetical protein